MNTSTSAQDAEASFLGYLGYDRREIYGAVEGNGCLYTVHAVAVHLPDMEVVLESRVSKQLSRYLTIIMK